MKRHVKGGLAANKPLGLLAVVLLAGLACCDSSGGGGTGGTGGSSASGGSGGSRGGSGGSTGGSGGPGPAAPAVAAPAGAPPPGERAARRAAAAARPGRAGATGGTGGAGTGGATGDAGGSTGGAGGSAGDAAGPAAGPELFIGEWDYTVGQAMLECPGRPPITQNLGNDGSLTRFPGRCRRGAADPESGGLQPALRHPGPDGGRAAQPDVHEPHRRPGGDIEADGVHLRAQGTGRRADVHLDGDLHLPADHAVHTDRPGNPGQDLETVGRPVTAVSQQRVGGWPSPGTRLAELARRGEGPGGALSGRARTQRSSSLRSACADRPGSVSMDARTGTSSPPRRTRSPGRAVWMARPGVPGRLVAHEQHAGLGPRAAAPAGGRRCGRRCTCRCRR